MSQAKERHHPGNSWPDEMVPGGVKVDMDKAREIHMGRIRKARDAKLKPLGGSEIAAISKSDDAGLQAILAQKQSLRDIPDTYQDRIEAEATPEELKAVWPAEL